MRRKIVELLIVCFLVVLGCISFVSCKGKEGTIGVGITRIEKTETKENVDVYTIIFSNGNTSNFTVTNGLNGAQGIQGIPGNDGKTPVVIIGENGNWYVDGVDTNQKAQGKSAYEIYKEVYNYEGSEEQWLKDLINGNLCAPLNYVVTFNPNNGEASFTQTVEYGEKVERPLEPQREGYVFDGWIYDDEFDDEKWIFSGYSVTEDITLTAKWDYATYELPILNIDTHDKEIDSKEKYTDMTLDLENCEEELFDITGGIRLRGNTTKALPKKPYRIKFDKKQSLFGLEKAKSWVLLAEYLDPSGLHNYTAFGLASGLSGLSFTPTPHKINVYLNGEFLGLYTLCEQVQENEGRMNIEMEEITEEMVELKDFNFFVCMDKSVIEDQTAVLDETYFYLEEYDKYFELKYPEKEDFISEAQFENFFIQLKSYIKYIMDAFSDKEIEKIKSEVNIKSLADYLIVDQIMGECDHYWKSFNMYYTNTSSNAEENRKLNFGPVWDYDWSLYTPWTGKPNQDYEILDTITYSNIFFQVMATVPEFFDIVKEEYQLYGQTALSNTIESFDELVLSMEYSIQLNNALWYSEIGDELSIKNIEFLKDFLKNRKKVLDEAWLTD